MCKACKMDDHEMQVFYRRQGMVEPEDFDEDVRYRHPKRRKKTKINRRPGCPENDYNKHVYVWVNRTDDFFTKFYGYPKHEDEVCCGCGKVGKKRRTAKYERANLKAYTKMYGDEFSVTRGEPVSRRGRYKPSLAYFAYEREDSDFMEAYGRWAIRNGLPTWYYSW